MKSKKVIQDTEEVKVWKKLKEQRGISCGLCGFTALEFIQSQQKDRYQPKGVRVNVYRCLSCKYIGTSSI